MWSSITAQEQEACRDFVPMLEQSTRTALHFGSPGARQARQCCLTHGLEGLDVEFFLHKEQRAQPRQRCRLRPGAPLKKGPPRDSLDETPPLICTPIP